MQNFSVFRQTPPHVSGVSTAHHQDVQHMDKTIGTYCFFLDDCLLSFMNTIIFTYCYF